MSWLTSHMKKLERGHRVECKFRGNSMHPKIRCGQKIKIKPLFFTTEINKGDIVACRVGQTTVLHQVKGIRKYNGDKIYKIVDNKGGVNGWVKKRDIFGILEEKGEDG